MRAAADHRRIAALTAALAALALLGLPSAGDAGAGRWKPKPTTAPWQWQLQGKVDTTVAARVYEVDGFDVGRSIVAKLHSKGRKVICYLDVGSWENYRPDRGAFPQSVIGNRYEGYPNERWLDIRRIGLLAKPLRARFELCKDKGFDAVEPDNDNGYTSNTGFPLTAADQLRFNRWISKEVHRRGMSVALKNDPEQADELAGAFDFAVVEECFTYHECGRFSPFVDRGKAVYEAEYELNPGQFCAKAANLRFSAIRKSYDLFAKPWLTCL